MRLVVVCVLVIFGILFWTPRIDDHLMVGNLGDHDGGKEDGVGFSVIVPTFKEAENIPRLLVRLQSTFEEYEILDKCELIIIDDNSLDGTIEVVAEYKQRNPAFDVRLIVREHERGLSSAVVHGFKEAKGKHMVCMDADLQHPPESVPLLLRALETQNCDFVIGTRYPSRELLIQYGIYDEQSLVNSSWGTLRRIISWGARMLAQPLCTSSTQNFSDPMSGFFGISKGAFEEAERMEISEIGFKISLELFVKSSVKEHCEVPFQFGVRTVGTSKLSSKVILHYLYHLYLLYSFRFPALWITLIQFSIVCIIGVHALILFMSKRKKYTNATYHYLTRTSRQCKL